MNKQFKIYSVDTKSFYNAEEEILNKQITGCNVAMELIKEYVLTTIVKPKIGKKGKPLKIYKFKDVADLHNKKKNNKYIKKYINKLKKDNRNLMKSKEFVNKLQEYDFYNNHMLHKKDEKNKNVKNRLDELKSALKELIENNAYIRELNPKKMSKYNLINLHDSDLSRILNLDTDEITTDLLLVRVYHYPVLEQLVKRGYNYSGEHYIVLTSSAGQIRHKKVLMIKGKVWNKVKNTVMCGLTIKDINESKEHGCNINKFLSYLALCASTSDRLESFDIDKSIVIDDFETTLEQRKVDYINNETFIVEKGDPKNIIITHSDGCGWMLPSESNKSFQFRMPWFKGLMTPVNYILWCDEYNNNTYKIKDIWGEEWDLKADDIKYVFCKSQFKMWRYYDSWDTYKKNFKKYNCHANYCNIEEDFNDFKKGQYSYQMWQTLLNITDDEIEYFTNPIVKTLANAYKDKDTMLKVLGATKDNQNKNYLQQALEIYPELLQDSYVKDQLGSSISKIKKDAECGKITINAKNTFLIPDVFAWMQFVFLGEDKITGLLKDGEVSCKLFKREKELLVERSPHLYREEAVRNNIHNKETNKWFITNGIYTSCHDLISKILQFDNDGDHAIVVAGKLVKIAKNNIKDVLPLFYDMGKAEPELINAENIYTGLITGFKYSNIGQYSNKLTALWNKNIITDDDYNTAKVITALNNYCIDAAKTMEMKKLIKGSSIDKAVKEINKLKMPYFFQFAKDKDNESVAEINNKTVNRICAKIEAIPQGDFDFSETGNFKYAKLMNNPMIKINAKVTEEYERLNKEMQKYFFKNESMEKEEIACAVWDIIKFEFGEFCKENNIEYPDAADMIIKHVYKNKRDSKKKLLFNVFGKIIVNNLKKNDKKPLVDGYIICSECGKRTKKTSNNQTMCPICRKKNQLEQQRNSMQKKRNVKICEVLENV